MTNSVPEEVLPVFERRGTPRRNEATASVRAEFIDVLFRRHYAGLVRLGFVMLGDREASEDAVQDAFVSLHRNLPLMRDPEAAEAYLRSAVLNRCRSWMRRQVAQRAPRPLMLVRQQSESPEDTATARSEVGSLVAAMRTLPRRQREVLACRYVLELSVAETARLLVISEGSVKTHTHRGLHAIQQRTEVTR